ncbi:MAG: MBL fold metallo-hydrolase [Pseudomonadota bacterium]
MNDTPITHPFAEPPGPGEAREVAEGILWARLPLPMRLDHVNVFALAEADGWTLVDTGLDWSRGREALAALRKGPLGGRPIRRVVLTHHHPDHVGQLGALAAEGAEVLATRIAWLTARMLTLDPQDRPAPEAIEFRRRAGVSGAALDLYATTRPFNFADCVAPMPLGFTALEEGMVLTLGGRRWTVHLGEGHAPAHATLWCASVGDGAGAGTGSGTGLALVGDQILATISPNIGVYPTEPGADPLGGWLESCRRLAVPAAADPLVLPGHHLPFRGAATRLRQLIENHEHALDRVMAALAERPRPAAALFDALFRRPIGEAEAGLALVEAVAHVNHLHRLGAISPEETAGGTLWHPQVSAWRQTEMRATA